MAKRSIHVPKHQALRLHVLALTTGWGQNVPAKAKRATRLSAPTPEPLVRYQFGNHLGSASLELNHEAKIIAYEEYTPYGSTSYQTGRSQAEVNRKQYRYTGMERDEESGFGYHSARYYLPWLGRWGSVDRAGLVDGGNLYQYGRSDPVNLLDTGGNSAGGWIRDTAVGFGHYSWGVAKGATYPIRHPIKTAEAVVDTIEFTAEVAAMATIRVVGDEAQNTFVDEDLEARATAVIQTAKALANKDPNEILEGLGGIVGGFLGVKGAQFAKKSVSSTPLQPRKPDVPVGQKAKGKEKKTESMTGIEDNSVLRPGGASRADKYVDKQTPASLSGSIAEMAGENPVVTYTTTGKQIISNPKTAIDIVHDPAGNYFRVISKYDTGESDHHYLSQYGNPIPNTVPVIKPNRTVQSGIEKGVRRSLTHFQNTDVAKFRGSPVRYPNYVGPYK